MTVLNRIRKGMGVGSGITHGLRRGLRRKPVVLVDIGGRGGLARAWHLLWKAGMVKPVFFEPEPKAAAQIQARYTTPAMVIQKAAWSEKTTRVLHITAQPGCSSILTPAPDPRMPQCIKEFLKIDRELPVELVTAEAALLPLGVVPEIVKIDVQGGELEVLKGFGSLLKCIVCCELEVSFMRCYEKQPLFDEVFDFMVDCGFGLFDMKSFGVAGTRNGVQANAYFCRRDVASSRHKIVETLFIRASDFSLWP